MSTQSCFVLSLLLAGCGSSSGPAGPVALGDYCERYAQITCEAADRCGCLEGIPVEFCVTFQLDSCRSDVEDPVASGRYAYEAAEAGACLAAIESMLRDCSGADLTWPESCDDMLVGQVPQGSACGSSSECLAPLECISDACTEMPRESQPCLDGYACADGFFCGSDVLCHAYRGRGGPCPEGDEACADELYCDVRTTTCEPYLGPGASCAHDEYACGDDLYCSPSSLTCLPYPGSGDGCSDSGEECADDLYCDAGLVCRPQLGAGSACTDDEQCLSWDCLDYVCEPEDDDICSMI